jgi:hypothetical protein
MRELEHNYRIQVYIRREGETIADGDEYKTEEFEDIEQLAEVISHFWEGVVNNLEEEADDENDDA